MSWQDCVREAIKGNPDLAASEQRIKQSKAQKWIAASPALPQISGELSVNKSDSFSSGAADGSGNTYSLNGEQLLFDGFKTFNDIRSANRNIEASKYGYVADSSTIRYDLRKAFVELLRAQTLIPITEDIIARRKQNLDMIRLKYESGGEHEGSLLLAEADLAQAQFDNKKAKRDVSVAQYALRKELGWDNDVPINAKGDFKVGSGTTDQPTFKDIAEDHPLVGMTRAEMESARFGLGSAKGEFFPEVTFNTEVGKVMASSLSDEKEWTVGINMTLPIVEGGRRIANTRNARAKLMQAESDAKSQYDDVMSTLEMAWQGLQDAVDNVEIQRKYLKAAEVRAKISRAEYANGLLIFDNWIIIEDNYVRAQNSYINAQADMLIAEAAWVKAKGGSLEYE